MKTCLLCKFRNKDGFTLVELIVVVAILGILISVLVPQMLGYIEKARETKDKAIICSAIRGLETVLCTEECYDEFMTDVAHSDKYSTDVYKDIAICLSDGPKYFGKGYTVWHLYDEDGNQKKASNSAIIAAIEEIIDPSKIHFTANSHDDQAYMIKIYKDATSNAIVVSPYRDEIYDYSKNKNDFYLGGWTATYYNSPNN